MYAIIYNPLSGGFKEEVLLSLVELFKARSLGCKLLPTQYAGHAIELARGAVAEQYEGIVAYGGDGTANEVLNGMAGSDLPLLLAPSGTGNDMIRTLNLPADPLRALEIQLDSDICRMDAVQINDRWCMNVAGLGLDVTVLREYEQLRSKMYGSKAYRLAILRALKDYRPEKLRISFDGAPAKPLECAFLSFGNGIYFGGGMKCMPKADPFDGLLDVMIIKPLSRLFIICILPLFFAGKHTNLPPVTNLRAKHIVLDADAPFWMQLDGEIHQMQHADIRIRPGLLAMRLPK